MYNILVLSTKNKGKLKEFEKYFKNTEYIIKSMDDIIEGIDDIEETGVDFKDNAIIKALYYSEKTDYPIIGEDSGLSVNILNGYPGIFSARIGRTDDERIRKILKRLEGKKESERRACFISVIALAYKNKLIKTFQGKVCGYITEEPMGYNGFGYDPVFYYKPINKTFAQIEPDVKNLYSHRGRAIKKLVKFLNKEKLF